MADHPGRLGIVESVQDAEYSIGPLLPGEYSVIAVTHAAFEFDWRDPLVLRKFGALAERVVVREGGVRVVSLRSLDVR